MPKLSFSKSIEARRLNSRTGLPDSGTESTVPYGAIVEHIATDRDIVKFSYLGEHYRCAQTVWDAAAYELEGAVETAAPREPDTGASAPRLKWEPLASSQYSLSRAKVPGGWLVTIGGSTLAFVPDPGHAWDGASPA
jgi:hypothetical protein